MFNMCYCREEIASGIAYACSLSIAYDKTSGSCHWDWLYAVPLLHQLRSQDDVKHDYMSVDPDDVDWGLCGLDKGKLQDFKCIIQDKRYSYVRR